MERFEPQAKGLETCSIGRRESFLKPRCDGVIVIFWAVEHGWEKIHAGGNCEN